MALHPRTLATALALAALPLTGLAFDAPPRPLTSDELAKIQALPLHRMFTAAAAPLPIVSDQSWIYREDIEGGATTRYEAVAAFQDFRGTWFGAVHPLDAAPESTLRLTSRIDGCLLDIVDGNRLQAQPCTRTSPGDRWPKPGDPASASREFKAVSLGPVQVPAGSFEALEVHETAFATTTLANGERARVPTSRTVYWYAASVTAMVRVEREVLRPDGSVAQRSVRVLESRGLASDAAKGAIRATPYWAANEQGKAQHARIVAAQAATPALTRRAFVDANTPGCRPEYPPAAIRAQAMGTTQLAFVIGPDGAILDSEISRESGASREHRLLDNAAMAGLSKCPFTPALSKDGTPAASVVQVTYTWKLE